MGEKVVFSIMAVKMATKMADLETERGDKTNTRNM